MTGSPKREHSLRRFNGESMVHGLHVADGKAFYESAYVKTPQYVELSGEGPEGFVGGLPLRGNGLASVSMVSLIWW